MSLPLAHVPPDDGHVEIVTRPKVHIVILQSMVFIVALDVPVAVKYGQ